jgi:glyoxylase-like metal-dependent hydrolase (beta-lactamase superfamily II)
MIEMREVGDDVIEIPIGYVNAYAVVVVDGVVLVDTGIPGRADKVARAVVAARRPIGEVYTILLMHCHPDHIGGRGDLPGGGATVPGVRHVRLATQRWGQ